MTLQILLLELNACGEAPNSTDPDAIHMSLPEDTAAAGDADIASPDDLLVRKQDRHQQVGQYTFRRAA